MKKTLKDKAYDIIKKKIISCKYKPNEFLSEIELMNEIEVGRTPIREALNKLEQEHLVKIIPKKGSLVSGIAYRDVKEIYEIRELIEPYLIRKYAHKVDKDKLLKLKDEFEKQRNSKSFDSEEMYVKDDYFHEIIFENSENKYFINLFNSINNQNQRIRVLSGEVDKNRMKETYDEHIEIINEILEDNIDEAAKIMEHHLKMGKEAGLKLFIEN
ncbi:GntR family transcriptional regulator [Clostridium sp. AL.422]|uniref:GntR family transcriptional regulator n=1 Tax=Clostridium TaxID=1485 RepID=UPI00293DF25F|nr:MULTISPECIES: GntR family transcriptional regulator [unclassified Clostridium]MDV4150467.1 GntR family transcriptional regulator [Clostridium sp. AL.422]